jgi:hypothetical protein
MKNRFDCQIDQPNGSDVQGHRQPVKSESTFFPTDQQKRCDGRQHDRNGAKGGNSLGPQRDAGRNRLGHDPIDPAVKRRKAVPFQPVSKKNERCQKQQGEQKRALPSARH